MPELPEVETIRRCLKRKIVSKVIEDIEVLSKKNFIGDKREIFGLKITSISRYGKVLVFGLNDPLNLSSGLKRYLNFHFKLSGQLLYADNVKNATYINKIPFTKSNKMPANTTRVIIKFTDKSGLFFNDLRKFGWVRISAKPLFPKGADVLSKEFTFEYFKKITHESRRPIKLVLLDQDKIAGVGNIYANDALFVSAIHPLRPANSLNEKEQIALYQAILQEIKKGVKHKGSSGGDEAFVLPDGSKGNHQRYFLVYQREGQPCLKCQGNIKRIKQNNRSTFFCPLCQK
ncbi:MAG: bifunctional DNA-formamidopyrimidine glycosylase/DNA-(apurinic or apyrimidinic site) lyase [Patescibacteria group bacterium]|nr:bifunctional DNA-formamidopyrimidine glycosylase/DNA-(apurinic or apyrimidinic site) lyase [Patescibacteria group bacterium]